MPEIAAALLPADDYSYCDLVIDTFDQMHNPGEFWLAATQPSICWAVPVDPAAHAA
jgi:hypothetical protein